MSDRWFADLEARLPQHARFIGALRDAVEGLAATYPVPDDYASVAAAASAVAALLADCTRRAATSLASDLSTPWETSARTRLAAALR